jgi:hypothetical protein
MNLNSNGECTRNRSARGAVTNKLGYFAIAGLAMLIWSVAEEPKLTHVASKDLPTKPLSLN